MTNRKLIVAALVIALFLAFFLVKKNVDKPTGDAIATVVVPILSQTEEGGKILFGANCAVCHGANAAGKQGLGPPLVHKLYEPNHHADGAFQSAAKFGVRQHHWTFGNMPPVPSINEVDMKLVINYVRKLQTANGIQ